MKQSNALTAAFFMLTIFSTALAHADEQVASPENKDERFALAREILREASESATNIKSRRERDFTFPHIAVSQGRAGDIAGALRSAENISDLKYKACALGDIALAQATQNQRSSSREIFEQALSVARSLDNAWDHALVLAKLAELQAGAQDTESAAQTFQQALKKASSVAEDQYKAGFLFHLAASQIKLDRSGAVTTMREASQRLSDGDDRLYITALQLVPFQAGAGDYQGARETALIFSNDTSPHRKDVLLESLATVQANAGDIEEALQTANDIDEIIEREKALSSIATAESKKGNRLRATEIIAGMNKNMHAKSLALLHLAQAQVRSDELAAAKQNVHRALDSIPQMSQGDFEHYPIVGIVRALIELGENENAESVATRIKLAPLTAVVVSDIAKAYAKAGDRKRAERLLKRALESPDRGYGLATIARTYAEIGNVQSALETANKIPRAFDKTSAFEGIADVQAQSGNIKEALKWARKLKSPYLKSSALLGAALGILQKLGISPNITVI